MVKIILVFILVVVSACSNLPKQSEKGDRIGWVLWFEEKLANEPVGTQRMLVTEDYLRIDSGDEADDFLLYDRQKKIIYNVVVEDETIMELNNIPLEDANNLKLIWRIEQEKSYVQTNRLGQQRSEFRRYFINEMACPASSAFFICGKMIPPAPRSRSLPVRCFTSASTRTRGTETLSLSACN